MFGTRGYGSCTPSQVWNPCPRPNFFQYCYKLDMTILCSCEKAALGTTFAAQIADIAAVYSCFYASSVSMRVANFTVIVVPKPT